MKNNQRCGRDTQYQQYSYVRIAFVILIVYYLARTLFILSLSVLSHCATVSAMTRFSIHWSPDSFTQYMNIWTCVVYGLTIRNSVTKQGSCILSGDFSKKIIYGNSIRINFNRKHTLFEYWVQFRSERWSFAFILSHTCCTKCFQWFNWSIGIWLRWPPRIEYKWSVQTANVKKMSIEYSCPRWVLQWWWHARYTSTNMSEKLYNIQNQQENNNVLFNTREYLNLSMRTNLIGKYTIQFEKIIHERVNSIYSCFCPASTRHNLLCKFHIKQFMTITEKKLNACNNINSFIFAHINVICSMLF